jgi:protein TonB
VRIVIVLRRTGSHLGRFVGFSAIVHGALLAAMLIVPWTRPRVAPIESATVVALAGPIGGASAQARPSAAAAQPEPPPPEPPKEAHTVKEIPKPKPKEKPEPPKKKEPAKPEPAPETGRDEPADTPPSGRGTPGPGAAPGPGTATGVTASIGGGDSALGWYGAAVKSALESAWAKPYLEDEGRVFSVLIAFDIARDGSTRNVRVVSPSGVPSLDRSALRAVIEASPLPAVPPAWTQDVLPVTMRFDFNPETN